jgi:hypothetical protein
MAATCDADAYKMGAAIPLKETVVPPIYVPIWPLLAWF